MGHVNAPVLFLAVHSDKPNQYTMNTLKHKILMLDEFQFEYRLQKCTTKREGLFDGLYWLFDSMGKRDPFCKYINDCERNKFLRRRKTISKLLQKEYDIVFNEII